jgi:hypothetical protein
MAQRANPVTTHPPEFQEQIQYEGLMLLHLKFPRGNSKCSSTQFWSNFCQRNHKSLSGAIEMMAILFPGIVERESYIGRALTWRKANQNKDKTLDDFIKFECFNQTGAHKVKFKSFKNNYNEICNEIFISTPNQVFLLDVNIKLLQYIKFTHCPDYLNDLRDEFDRRVNENFNINDVHLNAYILWLPWHNVFYIVHGRSPDKYTSTQQCNNKRRQFLLKQKLDDVERSMQSQRSYTFVPLPGNWLGWCQKDKCFNDHGLIRGVINGFCLQYQQSIGQIVCAEHISITSSETPLVSTKFSREECRERLLRSYTYKTWCKQFVKGDVFEITPKQIVDENIFVINTEFTTVPTYIKVIVMGPDNSNTDIITSIKVCGNTCSNEVKQEARIINCAFRRKKTNQTRNKDGNLGSLFTYGLHEYNGRLVKFEANDSSDAPLLQLQRFVALMSRYCIDKFPLEFSTGIQGEYSSGLTPKTPGHVAENTDENCVSSLNCSNRYASSLHKDVRDNGITCIGWFNSNNETHCRDQHKDVFFVFGNLKTNFNDKIYSGIAVKLYDGVFLSYDGRLVFHGTTIGPCDCNYGGFALVGNAVSASSTPKDTTCVETSNDVALCDVA